MYVYSVIKLELNTNIWAGINESMERCYDSGFFSRILIVYGFSDEDIKEVIGLKVNKTKTITLELNGFKLICSVIYVATKL